MIEMYSWTVFVWMVSYVIFMFVQLGSRNNKGIGPNITWHVLPPHWYMVYISNWICQIIGFGCTTHCWLLLTFRAAFCWFTRNRCAREVAALDRTCIWLPIPVDWQPDSVNLSRAVKRPTALWPNMIACIDLLPVFVKEPAIQSWQSAAKSIPTKCDDTSHALWGFKAFQSMLAIHRAVLTCLHALVQYWSIYAA